MRNMKQTEYDMDSLVMEYLTCCETQRHLDAKTLKAYRTDLNQFLGTLPDKNSTAFRQELFTGYADRLQERFQPRTAVRKRASLNAFCSWLAESGRIDRNPFDRNHPPRRVQAPAPETVTAQDMASLLQAAHDRITDAGTPYQEECALRDACVLEMLAATGMQVSELCALSVHDVDLAAGQITVHGKGARERTVPIGPGQDLLRQYMYEYGSRAEEPGPLFMNRLGMPLSDQSVRNMIAGLAGAAGIGQHVTPRTLRYTYAKDRLDGGADIRDVKTSLGHASVATTEIYAKASET